MNKKDLVIVALATFCLTSTLFMILPSKSGLPYDPWADVSGPTPGVEDGIINMRDIAYEISLFNTSGNTTKDVNVTNPKAKVVEKDLNISTAPIFLYWAHGQNYSEVFNTEGYDRMFVSVAIVDDSDHLATANVTLQGALARWYWGTVSGKDMTIPAEPIDYYKRISASVLNATELPKSSDESIEFAVKAPRCGLFFEVDQQRDLHNMTNGWVLIHFSAYLTVGTNSPPTVQSTYVTNLPYQQPQPAYEYYEKWTNTSITSGYGGTWVDFSVGGYSRVFPEIEIINASYQGVPIQTTVSLSSIRWEPYGYEYVPSGALNVTYDGTNLPAYSYQTPPEFRTKSSSGVFWFNINSGATFGWIEFSVRVYLRNE